MRSLPRSITACALALIAWHATAQFDAGGQFIFPADNAELSTADLDSDGDLDLFGVFGGDHLKWFPNADGLGGFGPMQLIADLEGECSLIECGDVDNDLDVDLLFVSDAEQAVVILRNDGSGVFQVDGTLPMDAEPRALRIADLTGDGFNDVVVTLELEDGAGAGFFPGSASGFQAFEAIPAISPGPASSLLRIGDVDLTGGLDLILRSASDSVLLLRNVAGDGTDWQIAPITIQGPELLYSYHFPELIDVDGDGDLDLAESRGPAVHWLRNLLDEGGVVSYEENVVEPWKSSGSGAFGQSICGPGACLVYIPNNPGLPVRWNSYLPTLGDFPYSSDLPGMPRGAHPLLADFNADGRDDLVMEVDGGIHWYENNVVVDADTLVLPTIDTLCRAGAPVALPEAVPAGGQWYGPQISLGLLYRSNLPGTMDVPAVHAVHPAGGCPLGAAITIRVIQGPVIQNTLPGVLCSADAPIQLEAVPSNVEWFGLDGSDIVDPATWNGGYIVCEYTDATGQFCSDVEGPIQRWITLPAQLAELDTLCTSGDTVPINVVAGPPLGVVWEGPVLEATSTGALFDPSIGPGTYTIVLNAEAFAPNQCRNSDTLQIVVDQAPMITFDGMPVYCAGGSPIELTGAHPAGGFWSGAGVSDGQVDPEALGAGTHLLNYFASSAAGCGTQAPTSITLANDAQLFWEANDLLYCPGEEPIQFVASPLGGEWNEPVNVAGVFDHQWLPPGIYPINYTYTDPRGCSLTNTPASVEVGTPKPVSISEVGTLCLNTPPFMLLGSSAGEWSGALTGTGDAILVDPAALGVGTWPVTLSVSQENECPGSASLDLVVEVCTGIDAPTQQPISAVPLPFSDRTVVSFGGTAVDRVELYDMAGQCVRRIDLGYGPVQQLELDMRAFADGSYLLRAHGATGAMHLRLLKAR